MHGRVKVKTTEEQQEAKRKERKEKLRLYKGATSKILFDKRVHNLYDEEGLKISGEILAVNPDFYTIWNFRKELFLHFNETKPAEEMQELFTQELNFLESCLRNNPKSYGTWHHRCFVMDTMPRPNWKHELQLCNLFLEYDERNFHCWDYRRFVVRRSDISARDELEFTTNKICNNFSNFSSWHYRSKLLPVIYPDDSTAVGVEEDILIKEFETVQNAFFTDPDDQSAWFYHRWLLGRGKKKPGVGCLFVSRYDSSILMATTHPVKIGPGSCEVTVVVNGEEHPGTWCNQRNEKDVYSNVWIFKSSADDELFTDQTLEVVVTADDVDWGSSDSVNLTADQSENWTVTEAEPGARFRHELSAATSATLQRELESVQELFEIEPDNKWVLLTIVSLMKALDPLEYAEAINEYIIKLQKIDPMRLAYYKDLRSKFTIENHLETYDFNWRVLSLPYQELTTMCHLELLSLVEKVDLSKNSLTDVKNFSCMRCVKFLALDGNQISDIAELSFLPNLELLSLRNNSISGIENLKVLSSCRRLSVLNIEGNPVTEQLERSVIQSAISAIPSLRTLDGEQLKSS